MQILSRYCSSFVFTLHIIYIYIYTYIIYCTYYRRVPISNLVSSHIYTTCSQVLITHQQHDCYTVKDTYNNIANAYNTLYTIYEVTVPNRSRCRVVYLRCLQVKYTIVVKITVARTGEAQSSVAFTAS